MPSPPECLSHGPFTIGFAQSVGVTPRQLQSPRFRRLFSGVYVDARSEVTTEVLARGVSLVLPQGAVVAGPTAALLHGADVRRLGDDLVYVVTARADQMRRRGVRSSAALREPGDVVGVHGVPCLSPVRAAFDLARNRWLVEAVVGVDAMLNRVPRPRAQVTLFDRSGVFVARLDHGYEEWKVGLDYDGEVHAETWQKDLDRQERIRELGWWHRRYTALDARGGWERMVAQVRSALLSAGWRPLSG